MSKHIDRRARELLGDIIGYDLRRTLDTDSMTVTVDDALTAISEALTAGASGGGGPDIDALVGRFLAWPLPATVCVDSVASYYPPCPIPRTGTNLLTATEARAMLEYVLAAGAPAAQEPLDGSANNAGVATGSRNDSPSESVTRGSLPPSTPPAHGDGEGGQRELLGKIVRMEWMAWAREQPNPKPSWLLSWTELSEPEREVDRRIGERIYRMAIDGLHTTRPTPEAQEARYTPEMVKRAEAMGHHQNAEYMRDRLGSYELAVDARRYRWLQENADIEDVFYGDRVKLAIPAPDIDGFNDLNDVIDAAMAARGEGES